MRLALRSLLVVAAIAAATPVLAQNNYTAPANMTDAITGTMTITFGTRTNRDTNGVPNLGAIDTYATDMVVLNSFVLRGDVTRQPWLTGEVIGGTRQQGFLDYNLATFLRNPADPTQTVTLGGWVGALQLDGAGKYLLAIPPSGSGRLRITADARGNIPGFVSNFDGEIQGRRPRQGGLLGMANRATEAVTRTYTRVMEGGQQAQITVAGADPMGFNNVTMAAGPLQVYPSTVVNGSMDYDPETGNWYVEITASYTSEGIAFNDRYSGTIRWIEDPNREANGLGYYELNVRINEQAAGEAAVFAPTAAMTMEEAFFATVTTVPGFTGRVSYQDTFVADTVSRSVVTYDIDANQASRIQIMNFAKLLFLIIGPFNDE